MERTPLYEIHKELGATFGAFEGWEMPLWYKAGQIKEHMATREACGMFDTCHMGEFRVKGKNTIEYWQKVLSNDAALLEDGQAQYNFITNKLGGVIDDCILYRFSKDEWLLVINASTIAKDEAWLRKHVFGDVSIENVSASTGKIDLQGKAAPKIIAKLAGTEKIEKLKFFRFVDDIDVAGISCLLSRTGYTGEIGFEIYCKAESVGRLWNALLDAGEEFGIMPAGLGARDTLRLEAGLPLYGHELCEEVPAAGTPWEFAINYDHDFIGREALLSAKGKHFVYAIMVDGRRKPGSHSEVFAGGDEGIKIGEIISESMALTLNREPCGFIRATRELAEDDTLLLKNARGKEFTAKVVANPIYKGTSRKKLAKYL